jgi:hypothetical protein
LKLATRSIELSVLRGFQNGLIAKIYHIFVDAWKKAFAVSHKSKQPLNVPTNITSGAPTALTGGPMPHATSKDDTYQGYYIPAGAGVVNCVDILASLKGRNADQL